jgi:hypothetical protein
MTSKSAYYAIAIVDIEQFGRRKNPDQCWLRRQMYEMLETAATRAGIPWSDCHRNDRGDGVITLIPASVPKEDITESFVRELDTELGAYARRSRESVAMRMRVALHAGDVLRDAQGWVSAELNTACRLVDLPALRNALAQTPSARLALIVSDMWFKTVVWHGPGAIDHRSYTRVPVTTKELDDWAWIHVQGHSKSDNPLSTNRTQAPSGTTPDANKFETPTLDGEMTRTTFSGPVIANTVVGHDQINHYKGDTPRQDR